MEPICRDKLKDAAAALEAGLDDDGLETLIALHRCSAASDCADWQECRRRVDGVWTARAAAGVIARL